MTVYLKLDATPSQTARVLAAVKREDGVSEVTLITKKAAFAKLKRRYPWLVERPSLSALPLEA